MSINGIKEKVALLFLKKYNKFKMVGCDLHHHNKILINPHPLALLYRAPKGLSIPLLGPWV